MSKYSIRPPLRINVTLKKEISDKHARKNVEAFLMDYQNRPGGSDATIRTRLEKLNASLRTDKK